MFHSISVCSSPITAIVFNYYFNEKLACPQGPNRAAPLGVALLGPLRRTQSSPLSLVHKTDILNGYDDVQIYRTLSCACGYIRVGRPLMLLKRLVAVSMGHFLRVLDLYCSSIIVLEVIVDPSYRYACNYTVGIHLHSTGEGGGGGDICRRSVTQETCHCHTPAWAFNRGPSIEQDKGPIRLSWIHIFTAGALQKFWRLIFSTTEATPREACRRSTGL